MRILGIHDGHNAAACLLEDGRVRAALQEERLTRVKNHDVFPARAIDWVLQDAGCSIAGLDGVALNGTRMPIHRDRAALIEATRWGGSARPSRALRRWARALPPVLDRWKARRRAGRLAEAAAAGIAPGQIREIDHHLCHAMAAYWGSPWRGKPALVLTCDGAGDDLCATVSVADAEGRLTRLAAVDESHSPALVYLTVTTLLGMVPNEHEYKLMGMAPYAEAEAAERAAAVFESMLEWDPINPLLWRRRPGVPNTYYCYDWLRRRLDLMRFDAICGGVQRFVERHLVEWARRAIQSTGVHKLALAGGVFMNVKANQAIAALPEVEDLFVFPSCGDETNAIGAAFGLHEELRRSDGAGKVVLPPIEPLGPIYWGSEPAEAEIEAALAAAKDEFVVTRPNDIAAVAAESLARGEVVARFVGRAEFGARALGNRSILANPSDPRVVRRINDMIKCRDFWMPFACTVLDRRAADYLVNPKALAAPYMILTFETPSRAATEIEAGLHPRDRTCRPQILARDWNPDYYRLIEAFEARTGIGGLLNTSFNLHGHPIVNSPAEALDVLRRSGLRRLILGPWWVEKNERA
jgi:carbamoyltransferase